MLNQLINKHSNSFVSQFNPMERKNLDANIATEIDSRGKQQPLNFDINLDSHSSKKIGL